jgi:hypothetical protein
VQQKRPGRQLCTAPSTLSLLLHCSEKMRTSVWRDAADDNCRCARRHRARLWVIRIPQDLARRARVQLVPVDDNPLRQRRVVHHERAKPAAEARGRALRKRGDTEPALNDERIPARVERDAARRGQVPRDWRRAQARRDGHGRAEAERAGGEALRVRERRERREGGDPGDHDGLGLRGTMGALLVLCVCEGSAIIPTSYAVQMQSQCIITKAVHGQNAVSVNSQPYVMEL